MREDSADGRGARNAIRRVEPLAKYPERRLTLLLAPRFLRAFCRTNEIPAVAVVVTRLRRCKYREAEGADVTKGDGR